MNKVSSPFVALRFRDFRLLWVGLLISSIGSQMQVVGITWHLYLLTHSAFSLGFIGLARFIPLAIAAPFGGAIVDRFDRRKVLLVNEFLMILFATILAVATFFHFISPLLIYLMLAFNSISIAIDSPGRQAMTPSLVPRRFFMKAVSLNTLMYQSSIVIGPSLAGFVIAYLGIGTIYALHAASYLAVVIALIFIHPPKQENKKDVSFSLSSIKEGVAFIRKSPLIYSTMLLDFIATFFGSANTLLPIFAKDILSVGPQGLGFLYAASSCGAVVTGLIFSSFHNLRNQGKILLMAISFYGLMTFLFGLSKIFYLSLLFLGLSGAGDVISTIIRNTIRQLTTPDYLRGRMTSINMIFYIGGPQLGEVEAGLLAGFFGAPVSVVIGGVGTVVTTLLIAFLVPKLRNYQGDEVIV